jgi:hypothetical protein
MGPPPAESGGDKLQTKVLVSHQKGQYRRPMSFYVMPNNFSQESL